MGLICEGYGRGQERGGPTTQLLLSSKTSLNSRHGFKPASLCVGADHRFAASPGPDAHISIEVTSCDGRIVVWR